MDSFEDFWRRYQRDHSRQGTRALHAIGTSLAIFGLIWGVVVKDPMIPILAILMGYLCAWSGHLFIEGNRPTMTSHPVWSFICDVRMFRLTLANLLKRKFQL
jgi:hypothetical protein